MQDEIKYRENTYDSHCHHHSGYCFVKWGLWFFIFGIILGFGVLIHYLLGSAYDNSQYFLSNITLWFGSPLALSSGFLQIGGLGMAVIGGLCIMASKCCGTTSSTCNSAHCTKHKRVAFALSIIGLIALFLTGYIGYYVIDYFWPGFYYGPIQAGKNLWLILQGLSILVYLIGVILATCCLCKCKREMCCTSTTATTPTTRP